MKKIQIPYGVQDYYPEECYKKARLEKALSEYFYLCGFDMVETPALEYFELFSDTLGFEAGSRMFKMTDNDGRLLVLRPDITVQICRMAAGGNFGEKGIKKLYYLENSFEYLAKSSTSRSREFAQAGVEMLGESGPDGDVEILLTAIGALKKAGLDDFLIDVGHAGFFAAVSKECGLSLIEINEIKEFVNNKDMLGLGDYIKIKKCGPSADIYLELPSLFGGVEVIKRAASLTKNKDALKALDDLTYLYSALKAAELEKYVSFDLGMLHGSYYDGIVFKGMAKSLGVPILDGGRYDALSGKLGMKAESVGFAIGIKRLMTALEKENASLKPPPPDIAYINLSAFSRLEYAVTEELRNQGNRVIKLFCKSKDKLLLYAKENGIKKALVFDGAKKEEYDI